MISSVIEFVGEKSLFSGYVQCRQDIQWRIEGSHRSTALQHGKISSNYKGVRFMEQITFSILWEILFFIFIIKIFRSILRYLLKEVLLVMMFFLALGKSLITCFQTKFILQRFCLLWCCFLLWVLKSLDFNLNFVGFWSKN